MVRGYTSNAHVATLTLYPQRSVLLCCNADSFCRFRDLTYERVRSNNSLCVCVGSSLDVTCAEHFALFCKDSFSAYSNVHNNDRA